MKTMLLVVMMAMMMVVNVMKNNRLSMWERLWVGKKWNRWHDTDDSSAMMLVVMMVVVMSMWERLWGGKKWSRWHYEDDCDNASDDKDLLTYADIFLHILTSPYLF